MKAKSLKHEGPSAWIWTGAYQVPCPTITGDIGKEPMSERQKINGGIFEEIASSQSLPRPAGLLAMTYEVYQIPFL